MSIFKFFLNKKNKTSDRKYSFNKIFLVDSMTMLPDNLGNDVYIIGAQNKKWVVFDCPSGCKNRVDVNLMQSKYPRWKLRINKKGISLWPSVWMPKEKCGSHFIIRNNQINWVD